MVEQFFFPFFLSERISCFYLRHWETSLDLHCDAATESARYLRWSQQDVSREMNLWSSCTWTKLPPSNFLRSSPLTLCTARWIFYLFIYLFIIFAAEPEAMDCSYWLFEIEEVLKSEFSKAGKWRRLLFHWCKASRLLPFDVQLPPVFPLWNALQPFLSNIIVIVEAHSMVTSQLCGLKLHKLGWNSSRQSWGRNDDKKEGASKNSFLQSKSMGRRDLTLCGASLCQRQGLRAISSTSSGNISGHLTLELEWVNFSSGIASCRAGTANPHGEHQSVTG